MQKFEKKILKDVSVENIKPYDNNPYKHSKNIEHIKNSLGTFGYVKISIVVDENMVLLTGHGTLLAANALSWETIPEVLQVIGMTDKQKSALRIADNSTSSGAEIDIDKMLAEVQFVEEDFGMEDFGLLGFKEVNNGEIFHESGKVIRQDGSIDKQDVPYDIIEDEAPDTPKIPKTVRGDIYELGNHRVMCGDSTVITDVEKLMDGKKADMYLSDPPYNVAYNGKTKDALTIQNDKMDNDSFRLFLKDAFSNIDAYLKPGGVFYIWHADSEGYNFRGACFDIGWQVRQCLIWCKNSMVMGRQDYHWKHEPCLYGWKDGASHLWATDRKQTTILNFERPIRNGEHPTMKPIALFAYQLQNNTKSEDIVIDNFLGSGTTIIACEQTNRKCYGIELDEKYCDVIVQRYVNFTGNNKVIKNSEEIVWE